MKDKPENEKSMDKKEKRIQECSFCSKHRCREGKDCYPASNAGILEIYKEDENLQLTRAAAAIEGTYYRKATRLEEIAHFAKAMGYKKLGIASCIGLVSEAQTIAAYLKKNFEAIVVICKNGGINKKELELTQIDPGREEIMCNPIGQALYLNQCGTELNLICGLCVGHDIIFSKYSEAPVTTIITKDRVLGHNPAAVVYSSYYRNKTLGL